MSWATVGVVWRKACRWYWMFERMNLLVQRRLTSWICLITNVLEGLVKLSWSCATEEEGEEWDTG